MIPAGSGEGSTVAERAEQELLTYLTLDEPQYVDVEALIGKYRTACEAFLLEDFVAAAATKNIESRLWAAHRKVNNKYRSRLAKFSNGEKRKRPVERRKVEKHYVTFIKSSMRFYRGYIQRLASHFKSPKEVLEVAHRFHLDGGLSAEPTIQPSQQEARLILDSCHDTLIRLGDLSRYRETGLQTQKRNWAPAVGYYDLATAIKPSSGASHNQLAAIALADDSHLRALYHLYRALSAHVHHARARENLEIQFKKILDRKNKGQLFPQPPDQQPGDVLQASFLYFHARLHGGASFPEHEELENDILTDLSVKLKESHLNGLLDKFTLSNIAAQHLANIEATDNASRFQAFLFFLRFNINMFSTLLRILIQELRQVIAADDGYADTAFSEKMTDRIGTTVRRILPCLRHYSSWLVSNVPNLASAEKHEFVGVPITEFWRIYAVALTLLARTFPRAELPDADYLLEEDEDTVAFAPFSNMGGSRRYVRVDGETVKPRRCDEGVQRHHPSVEMLVRVRGLLEDGTALIAGQVRIADQQMVDGLIALEASEIHQPTQQQLPQQIPPGDCGPSPIEDKSGESIWSSPSAPRTSSPSRSRPGTTHKDIARPVGTDSTAAAQSSTTRLQEELLRQQRDLEMQEPSSVRDLPTTLISPPQPATSARRDLGLVFGQDMSAGIRSPFASSPSDPSTMTTATDTFPSCDAPREVHRQPQFGAVGQIPPSGQGGGGGG